MPRRQNTAAQRARQAQRDSGGRYTAELRKARLAESQPGPFTLGELLTTCGTAPNWTGEHPLVDPEWAPEMFDFAPLGGPVPFSTVLMLLGELAPVSRSVVLELESRDGFHTSIVACEGRRFELVLSQDDYLRELCRTPRCSRGPVAPHAIPYCPDRHLAERPEEELVAMAKKWGGHQREAAQDRTAVPLGLEGDVLIAAAVARCSFTPVTSALLDSAYEDADFIEHCLPDEEAEAMQAAMDSEHLRFVRVAVAARTRIEQVAGGHCICGAPLGGGAGPEVPPQFCSAACATASGC